MLLKLFQHRFKAERSINPQARPGTGPEDVGLAPKAGAALGVGGYTTGKNSGVVGETGAERAGVRDGGVELAGRGIDVKAG
jgi:hypothetical protein